MAADLSKLSGQTVVRVFFAIQLPAGVQASLGAVAERFPIPNPAVRWTPRSNLHLTIRFLGEVAAERLQNIGTAAHRAICRVGPFDLRVEGLGAFPDSRTPRVLWAGIAHDTGLGAARRLHALLEEELAGQGFARDVRPLAPHITLARVRPTATAEQRRQIGRTLEQAAPSFAVDSVIPVEHVALMESTLAPGGARYVRRGRYRLSQSDGETS